MKNKIGESHFWNNLWEQYKLAPSIALCRVPELEYASKLEPDENLMDHCCGDGFFAQLAWPNKKIDAGCDINAGSIEKANLKGKYKRLDVCDVSKKLPYKDGTFNQVFNNSALEHILDVDNALSEISRVLARNGVLAFNVLNHRYFQWWPFGKKAAKDYRDWQPFYHALSLKEWEQKLNKAGMTIISVDGYFDREASSVLAKLDYYFSGHYIRQKRSYLTMRYFLFGSSQQAFWKKHLEDLPWKTEPDEGAGYFIKAVRNG